MNASASIAAIVRSGRSRQEAIQTTGLIDQLLAALKVYDGIADRFIFKVETGKAVSTETYLALKAARAKSGRIKVSI